MSVDPERPLHDRIGIDPFIYNKCNSIYRYRLQKRMGFGREIMERSKLINYSKLLKQTCVDYTQMSIFNNNPLIFKKGNGVYLWDVNDKRYIDTFGGVWVCIFGHNYKPINEVIINQLEKLTFYPGLHGISEDTLKFVEDFSNITPKNLNFVKAYSGGSKQMKRQ